MTNPDPVPDYVRRDGSAYRPAQDGTARPLPRANRLGIRARLAKSDPRWRDHTPEMRTLLIEHQARLDAEARGDRP